MKESSENILLIECNDDGILRLTLNDLDNKNALKKGVAQAPYTKEVRRPSIINLNVILKLVTSESKIKTSRCSRICYV